MSAKCKTQSAKCRNCVVIVMPPSDEGGGKIFDFDGGRDIKINVLTTPQSTSLTAPLTRGAEYRHP